jgi:hypothetical protein
MKKNKLALGLAALLGGILVYCYVKNKPQKKNYVSVKGNSFFTPEMGHFYKK